MANKDNHTHKIMMAYGITHSFHDSQAEAETELVETRAVIQKEIDGHRALINELQEERDSLKIEATL